MSDASVGEQTENKMLEGKERTRPQLEASPKSFLMSVMSWSIAKYVPSTMPNMPKIVIPKRNDFSKSMGEVIMKRTVIFYSYDGRPFDVLEDELVHDWWKN